nr:Ycf2 protein [Phlegmariurus squarrosus]
MHGFNKKGLLETKHLYLSQVVDEYTNNGEYKNTKQEKCFKFFKYLNISLHNSFLYYRGSKKYINYLPGLEEGVFYTEHGISNNIGIMPVYNQIQILGVHWWKDYVIEGIFPSRRVYGEGCISNNFIYPKYKNTEDIQFFFKFYGNTKAWETYVSDPKNRENTKISIDLALDLTEKHYLNRNKKKFEWLFDKISINHIHIDKQLINNSSTFWDLSTHTRIGRNNTKSNLSKCFSKNSSICWIDKRFTEDVKYLMNNLFDKREKKIINNFTKSISYAFSNVSSMNESFHTTTKEPINNKNEFDKKYRNVFLKYYVRSDGNRIVDAWNTRNKFKKFCLNFFVLPDAGSCTIHEKTLNINKLDFIIFINWNISRNILLLPQLFSHKSNRHYIFHFLIKYKKGWIIKINQFYLSIIKYNNIYERNELPLGVEYATKKFFHCITNHRTGTPSWYNSIINIKEFFFTYFEKSLSSSYLKHESIYFFKYWIDEGLKKSKIFNNIVRNTINQHSLNGVKVVRKRFYLYKGNKYVNWNLNLYKWSDHRTNSNFKRFSKRLICLNNYLRIMSNQTEILTNLNFINWSRKLENNYSKFYFICKNSIKKGFNFSNFDKSEFFYTLSNSPKIIDTKSISSKMNPSRDNEFLQELKIPSDKESVTPLILNEIPLSNFTINSFYNRFNINVEYLKLSDETTFFAILRNKDIWFDPVKFSNKSLLKTYFDQAIIPTFLDHLLYIQPDHNKKWYFYFCNTEKNIITDSKITYGHLLSILPKHNNVFISSFVGIEFYDSEENTILVTQPKVSNIFFKCLKRSYNQLFALVNNSYKLLLILLNQIKLLLHKKKNTSFTEHFSIITLLMGKQVVNLEIIYYRQSDIEIFNLGRRNVNNGLLDEKTLSPNLSVIQRQSYKQDLFSEYLLRIRNKNTKMFHGFKKLFLINDSVGNSRSIIGNKVIGEKNTKLILLNNSNPFVEEIKKKENLFLSSSSTHLNERARNTKTFKIYHQVDSVEKKNALFGKYTPWFFTLKWWKYLYNLLQTFTEILPKGISLNSSDQFKYVPQIHIQDRKISYDQPKKTLLHFVWSYSKSINCWNDKYLIIISLFLSSYLFLQNYLFNLIGSDYTDLCKHFGIIRYLIDRKSYWNKLVYQHPVKSIDTQNRFVNFLKKIGHYAKKRKLDLFTMEKMNAWLTTNQSLDIFPRKKELLIQSPITRKKIYRYGFNLNYNPHLLSNNFGYQTTQQGLYYLRYLAESFDKSLVNYPFYNFNLTHKWAFLAFWQKITSPHVSWQTTTLGFIYHGIPTPLHLGLSPSKGNLLVGPPETGRSYLIKNLAADSYAPSIQVSISELLYNEPNITTKDWNVLMDNLHQLALILELTKELSPCIMWIQNIHELNSNCLTKKVKSNSNLPLGLLLTYFRTNFVKNHTLSMIVFASTHIPEKMDPSLIYPNRLDRLMNIRMLSIPQRQKEFYIFLRSKFFHLENNFSCLNEFGYGTMGYNVRDLASLANEVLSINITYNESVIYDDIIRLAFHKQALGFAYADTNIEYGQNDEKLLYKVGKTIVQTIITKKITMNPLYKGNNFWKKRFYYLSEWFSEPPITKETTVKEFTILSHILECLAGSAARDSWFRSKNEQENLIPLDKYADNDSNSACTILESLLVEFPRLEIYQDESISNKMKLAPYSRTTNLLSIMHNIKFPNQYKQKLSELVSNIACSPRIWRFSFACNNIFNRIERPNDFRIPYYIGLFGEHIQTFSKYLQNNFNDTQFAQYRKKKQSPYNRVFLSKMRRISLQELECQLETMLLKEHFETLGIFSPVQYPIEYRISNKPVLFLGKRFVWDPTGLLSKNNHLAFPDQQLFVDEEMLRRFYVTYGTEREQVKSQSIQNIKQNFVRRGYSRDSISNLYISGLKQFTFADKQNIETFKSTERIGIQLKHPHLFAAVYSYQPWLMEYSQEKIAHLDLLNNHQKWLEVNSSLSSYSSVHSTMFESHQYLLNSFRCNKILLNHIIKLLLRNRWLFKNEIETLLVLPKG